MGSDLPFLNLAAPGFSTRGPEVLAARDHHWCARTPFGLAILHHRPAGQLLRDRRLRQGSHAWPESQGLTGSFTDFWQRSIISCEGTEHRALRELAQYGLAPEVIDTLVPAFERIADDLIAAQCAGTAFEFVADFSEPFAGRAIALLLGLPESDAPVLASDAVTLGFAMGVDARAHQQEVNAACDRLIGLANRLLDKAASTPKEAGFVGRILARAGRMGHCDRQALVDLIVIAIFGGVDTTRAQLAFAVALFIKHPGEWAALRREPGLIPNAIEEVIRTSPTTTWATREAVADFVFDGVTIAKGETLHILVHATGTDPQVARAGFNVSRRQKMHFGFGGGAHHCLGQYVARSDMAAALRRMLASWSGFEAAGPATWLPETGNTSPVTLPVRALG